MYRSFTVLKSLLVPVFLSLIFVLSATSSVKASHVMGADLTYECLGGDTYRIRLTLYRNCEGSALNDKLPIGFSSDSCGIQLAFDSVARVNIIDISPLCPSSQPLSNCIDPAIF